VKRALLAACAAPLETALRLVLVVFLLVALVLRFAVSGGVRAAALVTASITVLYLPRRQRHA
jgi:hypothetical protein